MNQFIPKVPNRGLHVMRMFISDIGTYEQQYRRPFESTLGNDPQAVVSTLQQAINPHKPITAGAFGSMTNQLIQPQLQPERPIAITNGWETHRFRWFMILKHVDPMGIETFHLLSGGTDHRGISPSGHLDPNMVFYINGTMAMRTSVYHTPTGNRTLFNVSDASQLLYREPNSGGIRAQEKQFRFRPADIFSTMDTTQVQSEMGAMNVMDARNLVTELPTLSRRSNAVPTQFLSNMFDTYRKAQSYEDLGQSEDYILNEARTESLEPNAQDNPFINIICQRRGVMNTSWFTWGDLLAIDPNVSDDKITQVVVMGSARQVINTDYNIAGQSRPWSDASTRHPQVAAILAQSVPSIMMELGLSEVGFHATNRTMDGQPFIVATNFNSFAGLAGVQLDMSQQLEMFKSRVWDRVLRGISFNNQQDFAIQGNMNLLGESILEIQLLDNETYRYSVPSFQDALLSPLITVNQNRPVEIASDMQHLFGQVLSTQHPMSFTQQLQAPSDTFGSVFGKI